MFYYVTSYYSLKCVKINMRREEELQQGEVGSSKYVVHTDLYLLTSGKIYDEFD